MSARRVPVVAFALPALAASVAEARHRMVAFAQEHTLSVDVHERVAIAFTEAFSNAVRHAYPEAHEPGGSDIRVSADVDDDSLEIVVADAGRGFRSSPSHPGLGAGMGLIANCSDAFALRERRPGGTEVWMQFRL